MSASSVTVPHLRGRRSLVVTSLIAVVLITTGWLVGNTVTTATSQATGGGLTFRVPAGWAVLEETDTHVVLGPDRLLADETVVIYLPGSQVASGGVDGFLNTAPGRFLLFAVDTADEQQASFRYVGVDRAGGPEMIMGGRFMVFDEAMAAVVFAPLTSLDAATARLDMIVETVE